jgi:hypothetical protein
MVNAMGRALVGVAAAASLAAACEARGEVKVEKVAYMNMPNCTRLSNGTVEVICATDAGPRILRYAFIGDDNILAEMPDAVVKTDLGEWKPLGGHRLWTAPEAWPRTYAPDSAPVEMKQEGSGTVRFTAAADAKVGIQKEMVVTLDDDGTGVTILHRLVNRNFWAADVAPWGLTILSGGGTTIIPQEPFISHDDTQNGLLPARVMVLWPYTDFTDTRWAIGKNYVRLKTDENIKEAQKIGMANKQGWAGYSKGKTLFVKRFPYLEGQKYPDNGANCETYTAGDFMELETLAPMRHLNWGESAEHTERWRLYKDIDIGTTEATLDAAITPLIAKFPK